LREHEPQLPVIVGAGATDGMFTARVAALEPAAVIHHPYRPEQLLRLVQSFTPAGRDLTLAPLPINLGRLRIEPSPPDVEIDGTRTTLPRREYLLLRYLAEREGTVVPRTEIAQAVWGAAGEHTNNTLAVHVMRLRRRLDPQGLGPQWITAIRGIGYRLAVPSASDPGR
jgi:DNA-binding response OmpR family regulator